MAAFSSWMSVAVPTVAPGGAFDAVRLHGAPNLAGSAMNAEHASEGRELDATRASAAAVAATATLVSCTRGRRKSARQTGLRRVTRRALSAAAAQAALKEALGELMPSSKANAGQLRPLIVAMGTRGDVEPCLHLARALIARGHKPLVVSLDKYKSEVVDRWGLEFCSCGLANIPMNDDYFEGQTRADQVYADRGWYGDAWVGVGNSLYAAATEHQCDVIVSTSMGNTHSLDVAERLGLVCLGLKYGPDIDGQVPVGDFAPSGYPSGMPAQLNVAAHVLENLRTVGAVFAGGFIPRVNQFRAEIGLPAQKIAADIEVPTYSPYRQALQANQPCLYAYSEVLTNRPDEYKPWHFVTGVMGRSGGDLEASEKTVPFDPALEAFFKDAEASDYAAAGGVVCIAFGSMTLARTEDFQDRAISAGQGLGLHVLVVDPDTRTEGVDVRRDNSSSPVYRIKALPYAQLFPRCGLVVHHGGAGTMQDCLWAGVPQIAAPVLRWSDQPFWAAALEERGLGLKLGDGGETPDKSAWAAAFKRVLDKREDFRAASRGAAKQATTERGAEVACEVIEGITA